MKAESKNKESFIKELKSNLAEHISDKDLDAWFFNWFDDDKILFTAFVSILIISINHQ